MLVAVRGGDTYWHPRASGEDALAMLLDEFIPYCRRELRLGGAAGEAVMGWSMGGYGALLAAESRPRGFQRRVRRERRALALVRRRRG